MRVLAFGYEVMLVRYEGRVYALEDVCPHRGGPMHQGEVVHGSIECPLHGWAFSLETGACRGRPGTSLPCFAVEEADAGVFLLAP